MGRRSVKSKKLHFLKLDKIGSITVTCAGDIQILSAVNASDKESASFISSDHYIDDWKRQLMWMNFEDMKQY